LMGGLLARPSTASLPITVLLYDGPLLCGFNVAIKGLRGPGHYCVFSERYIIFIFIQRKKR